MAVALALPLLVALWALAVEPRLIREARLEVPLGVPLRVVHLADLHVRTDDSRMHRLTRRVAAARPDLVLVSGDWVHDAREHAPMAEHARQAAGVARRLVEIAPVYSVQGHSDYLGVVVAEIANAGVRWLDNEGVRVGVRGEVLLLGVGEQAGWDAAPPPPRFTAARVDGRSVVAYRREGSRRNAYLSWDPSPQTLADDSGTMAWSGYDLIAEVRTAEAETAVGIAAHARHALGEDRVVRLARGPARGDDDGSFELVFNGSHADAGRRDTGVVPVPGRWYRLRLSLRVSPGAVTARARAWPAGEPEPAAWQAEAVDRGPRRVEAGTVALWGWGPGGAAWRDLLVLDETGGELLRESFTGGRIPPGWREGTRASRVALARARSEEGAPPRATLLLTHGPGVVLEAAAAGIDLVLAGHTHGGQVRLPLWGALTTRSALGRRYDRGLFRFGDTRLHISPGIGTSLLPVRFWSPPGYAVIDLAGERDESAGRR